MKIQPIDTSKEYVILPLFSERGGIHVPPKSGLNQWNALGRPRNYDEVYIPIPLWIHNKLSFFPNRDTPFNLILPNGKKITAKVCQDNGKALMSNPNSELGQWLLRDVFALNFGELATYSHLKNLGIDSVVIYKENTFNYYIDCCSAGSYHHFKYIFN